MKEGCGIEAAFEAQIKEEKVLNKRILLNLSKVKLEEIK